LFLFLFFALLFSSLIFLIHFTFSYRSFTRPNPVRYKNFMSTTISILIVKLLLSSFLSVLPILYSVSFILYYSLLLFVLIPIQSNPYFLLLATCYLLLATCYLLSLLLFLLLATFTPATCSPCHLPPVTCHPHSLPLGFTLPPVTCHHTTTLIPCHCHLLLLVSLVNLLLC
jgi:hypothetical protein